MTPHEVRDFWFGAPGSALDGQPRREWFVKSEAFDQQIRQRFGAAIDTALAGGSLTIGSDKGCQEWRFVALALANHAGAPLSSLATELSTFEGVDGFSLSHARN